MFKILEFNINAGYIMLTCSNKNIMAVIYKNLMYWKWLRDVFNVFCGYV